MKKYIIKRVEDLKPGKYVLNVFRGEETNGHISPVSHTEENIKIAVNQEPGKQPVLRISWPGRKKGIISQDLAPESLTKKMDWFAPYGTIDFVKWQIIQIR